LTFYCAIEKTEFKSLCKLKTNMFNFTMASYIYCFFFTLFTTIMEKDRMVLGVGHLDYGCELQSNHKI